MFKSTILDCIHANLEYHSSAESTICIHFLAKDRYPKSYHHQYQVNPSFPLSWLIRRIPGRSFQQRSHSHADDWILWYDLSGESFHIIHISIYDPGSRFATPPPPPPPHMVWSQNLRFAAFRMKTLDLQCFLHGGLLVRSATLQIRWIFATNLPKTCYLQCFGFDIVE